MDSSIKVYGYIVTFTEEDIKVYIWPKKLYYYRPIFKEHKILTVYSLYICKVILIAIHNYEAVTPVINDCSPVTRRKNIFKTRVNKNTEKNPFIKCIIYYKQLSDSLKVLTGKPFMNSLSDSLLKFELFK